MFHCKMASENQKVALAIAAKCDDVELLGSEVFRLARNISQVRGCGSKSNAGLQAPYKLQIHGIGRNRDPKIAFAREQAKARRHNPGDAVVVKS